MKTVIMIAINLFRGKYSKNLKTIKNIKIEQN